MVIMPAPEKQTGAQRSNIIFCNRCIKVASRTAMPMAVSPPGTWGEVLSARACLQDVIRGRGLTLHQTVTFNLL